MVVVFMTFACIKQGYNRPLFCTEPYQGVGILQNDVRAGKKLWDYVDNSRSGAINRVCFDLNLSSQETQKISLVKTIIYLFDLYKMLSVFFRINKLVYLFIQFQRVQRADVRSNTLDIKLKIESRLFPTNRLMKFFIGLVFNSLIVHFVSSNIFSVQLTHEAHEQMYCQISTPTS